MTPWDIVQWKPNWRSEMGRIFIFSISTLFNCSQAFFSNSLRCCCLKTNTEWMQMLGINFSYQIPSHSRPKNVQKTINVLMKSLNSIALYLDGPRWLIKLRSHFGCDTLFMKASLDQTMRIPSSDIFLFHLQCALQTFFG